MTACRLLFALTLAASASFAQYCDKFEMRDVDAILGGQARPLGMGALGCSYSVHGKTARLTLTLSNEGTSIAKNFDTLKKNTKAGGWFVGDEPTLGASAFSEWIKPGPKTPAGKCGFAVVKGSWLILIYISDSGPLASRRDTLDKLRPIAKRVIDKI